jgi:hypothetical protein
MQEGAPDARKRASIRIVTMHWAKLLTSTQMKTYVGALWSKTDVTGFPENRGFAPWVLLKLHERRPGEAREAVARFFLKSDIDAVPQYMPWLSESTAKDWDADEEDRAARIEWTVAEAEGLLRKIVAWCRDKLKSKSNAQTQVKPGPFTRSASSRGGRYLVRVIADVFVRYLAKAGSETGKSELREFVTEIEAAGVSILTAEPALLMLDPGRKQETARRIRASIQGTTEAAIADGCEALFSWLAVAGAKHVEAPPPALLDDLIGGIVMRRQPGLSIALQQMQVIVQRLPDSLDTRQRDDLALALRYLQDETNVAGDPKMGATDPDELPFEPDERVDLRRQAARLAAHLARYYAARELPLPPEIEAWRTVSTTDPLPEVRWPWMGIP